MTTHSSTVRADTQAVTIAADPARVFEFIADPRNLPRWAVGFAAGVRPGADGQWMVTTGRGAEVMLKVIAAREARTVDFHLMPAPGVKAFAYARVLANGTGAEFIFTQLQADGMDDATFEAQAEALGHELIALKAVMEVSCPG
jgi:uncharacterized protein YndB with AHSA1/START domain